MKFLNKPERVLAYGLALLMAAGIGALMLLPFVLAILFGWRWLYLCFVTVPAYFAFMLWLDRRGRNGG